MNGIMDSVILLCHMICGIVIIASPIWACAGVGTLLKKRESKKLAKMEESKVENLSMQQCIERLQKEAKDSEFMKKVEEYGKNLGKK